MDEILALNPGYKRPVLPTNGSMSLVILAEKVEAFLVNLQRHDPASASWKTYELREGEGLEGVADRLGISASRLRQVNGPSPRPASARATPLIIPSENEGDRITLSTCRAGRSRGRSRPRRGWSSTPCAASMAGWSWSNAICPRARPRRSPPGAAEGQAEAAPASRGKQAESRPEPGGSVGGAGSKPLGRG